MAAGTPVEEAGVQLVSNGNRQALADALCIVLQNDMLRGELRNRSMRAQQRFFSWRAIADRYAATLRTIAPEPSELVPARKMEGAQYKMPS